MAAELKERVLTNPGLIHSNIPEVSGQHQYDIAASKIAGEYDVIGHSEMLPSAMKEFDAELLKTYGFRNARVTNIPQIDLGNLIGSDGTVLRVPESLLTIDDASDTVVIHLSTVAFAGGLEFNRDYAFILLRELTADWRDGDWHEDLQSYQEVSDITETVYVREYYYI